MPDSNNNTHPTYGIEKYSGTFDQDDLGVTQIPTETIKSIRNLTDLALYTFLASCSKDWKLNPKHLASHFNCNKEKIYKSIESLISLGLLSRTITRDAGKFAKYHYRLHLRQIAQSAPFPEKPDTVKPDTVFPDTYKTKKVLNKEEKKKDIPASPKAGSKKVIRDYEKDERFMRFYSAYPKKEDPRDAWKAFKSIIGDNDELLEQVIADIELRNSKHSKWQDRQYIKYPAVYLRKGEYLGEIFNAENEAAAKNEKEKQLAQERLDKQEAASRLRSENEKKNNEQKQSDAVAYRNTAKQAPSKTTQNALMGLMSHLRG